MRLKQSLTIKHPTPSRRMDEILKLEPHNQLSRVDGAQHPKKAVQKGKGYGIKPDRKKQREALKVVGCQAAKPSPNVMACI